MHPCSTRQHRTGQAKAGTALTPPPTWQRQVEPGPWARTLRLPGVPAGQHEGGRGNQQRHHSHNFNYARNRLRRIVSTSPSWPGWRAPSLSWWNVVQ